MLYKKNDENDNDNNKNNNNSKISRVCFRRQNDRNIELKS